MRISDCSSDVCSSDLPIDACLRDTLRTQPADPVVLGALSWLRFGDWQPLRGTEGGKKAFAEARALALRAYESGPNSTAGLFAMARPHFYAGDCAGGESMGDAALQLNVYDPDIKGFLGLFNAASGQGAPALPPLKSAADPDARSAARGVWKR